MLAKGYGEHISIVVHERKLTVLLQFLVSSSTITPDTCLSTTDSPPTERFLTYPPFPAPAFTLREKQHPKRNRSVQKGLYPTIRLFRSSRSPASHTRFQVLDMAHTVILT